MPSALRKKYAKEERIKKAREEQWFNGRSIIGIHAMWYFLIGARERGKSYWTMDFYLHQYKKYKRPFYWLRLSDTEAKGLLQNNALKLVDPDLRRKYKLDLITNADCVYNVLKRGKDGRILKKELMARVFAIGTFQNQKGEGIFDKDYIKQPNAYYNICLDEFNREPGTKKNFPIVACLVGQLENLIRSTKEKVRIICIANNTNSCSELLSAFNFLPQKPGRYKLKSKKAVIEVIENNEAYKKRREGTVSDILTPDASNYTNETTVDTKLIINKKKTKLTKVISIIKFTKNPSNWYTLWEGNIISQYNKESAPAILPLRRYIDERYNEEKVKNLIMMYDARAFKFKNLITMLTFEDQLISIKPAK